MYEHMIFVDTETTGLDPTTCDIIQFSALIVKNGKYNRRYINEYLKPKNINAATYGALHLLKIKSVKAFDNEKYMYPDYLLRLISETLREEIGRSNKKFILVGYNIDFDKQFIINLYKRYPDYDFFNYVKFIPLDVMQVVQYAISLGLIDTSTLPNLKLESICKHLGITIKKAHDSLNDIVATYKLYRKLNRLIKNRNGKNT